MKKIIALLLAVALVLPYPVTANAGFWSGLWDTTKTIGMVCFVVIVIASGAVTPSHVRRYNYAGDEYEVRYYRNGDKRVYRKNSRHRDGWEEIYNRQDIY